MRVEDAGSKKGCFEDKYCRNGKPKPTEELTRMRTEGQTCNNCHLPQPAITEPKPPMLSDGGHIDPELEAIMDFWDYVVSPFADGLEMHEAYVLASSKWYKTFVWTFPTGYFEAGVAGYRQYYRDSWWESYNPVQRTFRIAIVASETYAIDRVSTITATLAGGAGGFSGGPVGAAGSYGVTAYGTSKAGNDLATEFNRWAFPTFGLGLY